MPRAAQRFANAAAQLAQLAQHAQIQLRLSAGAALQNAYADVAQQASCHVVETMIVSARVMIISPHDHFVSRGYSITPQAIRAPAFPVASVSAVAAELLGVYWSAAVPSGML
jgi:hypothetical protein